MPTISMFYGIIIRMYFAPKEHPPPHFHVYYNEYKATVDIRDCDFIQNNLPTKQSKLVLAWAEIHQEELMADWELVMNGEEPFKIQPLQQECVMYPSVSKVKADQDYNLLIEFDNGESGMLDMKPFLDFGVFQKLQNFQMFQTVKVSYDTVEWDCGVDLDPEFVYEHCQKQVPTLNI